MQGYGDNFIVVIPIEEADLLHTSERPFCRNETCYCHEDKDEIARVQEYYWNGLLTAEEATRMVGGKQL